MGRRKHGSVGKQYGSHSGRYAPTATMHTMARLMREQWQFKFFDVSQVKLPDEDSSFLSEV